MFYLICAAPFIFIFIRFLLRMFGMQKQLKTALKGRGDPYVWPSTNYHRRPSVILDDGLQEIVLLRSNRIRAMPFKSITQFKMEKDDNWRKITFYTTDKAYPAESVWLDQAQQADAFMALLTVRLSGKEQEIMRGFGGMENMKFN
ncbi:hypothetical protein HUE56_06260 (plasmid) [Azospirillum oryzae]|uniref:Uncharacterized protein n=1 Tax=Azospirillum oryzae TaxID=286727 RepID=A0A6N1AG67_9PROT|nr:hypothetical protein [Azospirillum oryzae]KAA0588770.1 hypothetical protein FZ938_12990 [Azospirillum oryzae]QKS50118.1 hypothetical protein HUE56_06260 [Azospirillum oryzae]